MAMLSEKEVRKLLEDAQIRLNELQKRRNVFSIGPVEGEIRAYKKVLRE